MRSNQQTNWKHMTSPRKRETVIADKSDEIRPEVKLSGDEHPPWFLMRGINHHSGDVASPGSYQNYEKTV